MRIPTKRSRANDIAVHYAYGNAGSGEMPSAVQQSVPGWLVFGMFFVVVPVSNTFIRERQLGTLRRLRSTNLGQGTVLLGKLIPYFAVNQLQVVLMLAAGCWLVPLLGGEALRVGGSWLALATIAASLSIAALGLALLIAVVSRTTEQATLLGGTGNILLAAIGGIMVPKFVMPEAMRQPRRFLADVLGTGRFPRRDAAWWWSRGHRTRGDGARCTRPRRDTAGRLAAPPHID